MSGWLEADSLLITLPLARATRGKTATPSSLLLRLITELGVLPLPPRLAALLVCMTTQAKRHSEGLVLLCKCTCAEARYTAHSAGLQRQVQFSGM